MKRIWTEDQKDAIEAHGGNVLVSAAAGSGKTAVLVERVTRRILDTQNPVNADRFLIVTFTRAAAGEMRERIDAAIDKLIAENPGDSRLVSQKMLLSAAKICTIDSFCSSLVRENFNFLDLAPDFKTADEGELSILCNEACENVMEELYNSKDASFRNLVELLFAGRDDSKLSESIMTLYKSSRSFPFPDAWLDSLVYEFENNCKLSESRYGEILFSYATDLCNYSLSLTESSLCEIQGDEELEKMLYDALTTDKAQYVYILEKISLKDWDGAKQGAMNFKAARRGNTPKHLKDDPFVEGILAKRKDATENIKALSDVFCCSEADFYSDNEFFAPMIKCLVEAVKLYSKELWKLKKEKKIADFDDITHAAIDLLVKQTPDGWERTEKAESLSQFYEEILIDEYQDTNKAQDMLFTAISRDNLFRVGDVKQSIYSFRQAMPQIFLELKDSYNRYRREEKLFPAKVLLGNNFRSRKGVTDIINFVFSQLMSKESGDIEYGSEEELVPLASYSEKTDPATELHIIDTVNLPGEDFDKLQAAYIADRILSLMAEGFTVREGDGERKASFGDFTVLLRSVSKKAQIYADVFREKGIPCFTETGSTFLTSREISLALNFLRIIDNPKQDIPLLSVMMSPVFAFTPDDVSLIRLSGKGDIYSCILSCAQNGNEKAKAFLDTVSRWRNLSVCLPASELITELYNETGLPSIFDAVDKSGMKRANLMLLFDYACTYEKSGYAGLSSFIRFVDRLSGQKQDLTGALGEVQSADVVKIMSIHKSKGLEFPVCILADCSKKFNRMDEMKNLIVNLKHGLGIVRRDLDTFEQYRTICHSAVKLSMHRDSVSEELRVLYVAMTRAKEKLIMVADKSKTEAYLYKCSIDINRNRRKITPYAVTKAGSYMTWLVTALLRHPDSGELRLAGNVSNDIVLNCDSPLKVVLTAPGLPEEETVEPEQKTEQTECTYLDEITEKLSYRYPYEALSGVMTKRAASEVDRNYIDRDYFASSMPSFLAEGGLTGAQRGIATHTFIQFADYEKAKEDLDGEIDRLTQKGILTDVQAKGINKKALCKFFESELLKRILASELVMREKKFTLEVPIGEVYPDLEEYSDEKMMIQGIADCAFLENGELVVVDYKTDALNNETDFVVKYASQVLLYKKALRECTGYNVKSAVLYSFHLGKEIEVL